MSAINVAARVSVNTGNINTSFLSRLTNTIIHPIATTRVAEKVAELSSIIDVRLTFEDDQVNASCYELEHTLGYSSVSRAMQMSGVEEILIPKETSFDDIKYLMKTLTKRSIYKADSALEKIGFILEVEKYTPEFATVFYKMGLNSINSGNMARAINIFTYIIENDPKNATAHFYRGIASYGSENNLNAYVDFQRAILFNPTFLEAYLGANISKLNLSKEITLSPKIEEMFYSRGLAEEQSGDINEAITEYSMAINNNPEFADAYFARGVANLRISDLKDAKQDFTNAIIFNVGTLAEAYYGRSVVNGLLKYKKGADADLETALRLME